MATYGHLTVTVAHAERCILFRRPAAWAAGHIHAVPPTPLIIIWSIKSDQKIV
jgi:hypothetical protein